MVIEHKRGRKVEYVLYVTYFSSSIYFNKSSSGTNS